MTIEKFIKLNKAKDFKEAWANCKIGDWMLGVAKELGINDRLIILAEGLCANTVRHLMKDERSIKAVDVAIAFGRGEATKDELDKADYDAYLNTYDEDGDAAFLSDHSAALHAASAALHADHSAALHAASAALHVDHSAALHAANAFRAAALHAANAANAARMENEQQTADICREVLTEEVFKIINKTTIRFTCKMCGEENEEAFIDI